MHKGVAIIILNYNGRQYLPDCLSSLAKIRYPKENFKIIVVDNASEDGSVEYIKNNWAEIILIKNEKNLGFAEGNNVGMRYAIANGFDYVYLLNQDTVVEPEFLTEAVKLAEREENLAAVQSKLLYYDKKDKINSWGNEIHFLGFGYSGGNLEDNNVKNDREITYASGAASLWKVKVLKEISLFDEKLFAYHEDLDLGWRARLQGYKIMLAASSKVYHKYEFSRSIEKYYFMERNRFIVILQNYKWPTLFLIGPAMDLMEIGLFLFSFKSGWWREKIKVYKYLFLGKNLERIFETRRKIQQSRRVKDRDIIKYFVGEIKFQELKNPILNYLVNPFFNLYWQVVKRLIFW